jgi:hypothetical protein
VRRPLIFLNELSYRSEHPTSAEGLRHIVLSLINALRAARRIRRELNLCSEQPLVGVLLGDGTHSFHSLLRGNAYKEEWQFLRNLAQSSPWDAHPDAYNPGLEQDVRFLGAPAHAMAWARRNGSPILSFGFFPYWSRDEVEVEYTRVEADAVVTTTVVVPNLSGLASIARHRKLIASIGRDMSSSSLVCRGDGFVVRMWSEDHDPPHFHVLPRASTSRTLAKYRIDTLEVMEGKLGAALRNRVNDWARRNAVQLMENWHLCRNGDHPMRLDD